MKASELIGKQVRDRDGRPIGVVTDLRCVQDGPPRGPMAALRVDALVLSRHHTGALLGYGRSRQRGPWLVNAVIAALHRNVRTVPWEQVADHDSDRIALAVSLLELDGSGAAGDE